MKERRYKNQYRIVTDVDPVRGKPRETAVYAGEYWRFAEASPPKARLAAGVALYWLFALIYLRTARATDKCLYALIPCLCGLFPAAYAAMGLFVLLRAPRRMTVVQKESGVGRLIRSGIACAAFSAAGALGCAAYLTLSGAWPAGWHEPLLCAAASACGWAVFATARRAERSMIATEGDGKTTAP